jgi:hypothetical protein
MMVASGYVVDLTFAQLGLMRDVLELMGRIRQIQSPITSPDGLRQTIELVLHFAELLGVSGDFADRLRQILNDESVFQIVLSIVRFLLDMAGAESAEGNLRASFDVGNATRIERQSFLSWLPIVVQIINLIRRIRCEA